MPKKIVCFGGIEHGRYWPDDVKWIETRVDGVSGSHEFHRYEKQAFDGAQGRRDAFVLEGLSLNAVLAFLGDSEFQRLLYNKGARPRRDVVSAPEFAARFPTRVGELLRT